MKGITWSRDSHGLFDYESRNLTKKTLKVENEIMLQRSVNDVNQFPYSRSEPFEKQVQSCAQKAEDKVLMKLVNLQSQFYLESASCDLNNEEDMRLPGQPMTGLVNLNENMYLIVRSLKRNNEKVVSSI